ncbi:hypothetical protein C8A01DRAFT_14677 [Parachaetomium inaequale]|uniref:Uncharacterized protein n=1 Tax=Parachaetomium inaequale TaxID=2588326 RepID=A0AAN6PJ48_9PEZI|nr:hypothetical protein C8A01DRAFT_14677 [Parachaetomium inaequale]
MSTSTAPQTHPENKPPGPGDTIADLAASLLSSPKHTHSHHHTTTTTTNNNNNHDGSGNSGQEKSASAARAMSHTGAWKPALDGRQSWSAQEYKHDLLKRQYMAAGPGEEAGKGGGFSEV